MPAPKRNKVASSRSQQASTRSKSTKAPAPAPEKADSSKNVTLGRRTTRQSAGNAKSSSDAEVWGPQTTASDDPDLMMTVAVPHGEQQTTSPESDGAESPQTIQQDTGIASRRTSIQRPASVLRAFGTPGMENSMFKFKKRRRQGSIISQVQRTIGLDNTELGETDFDLDLDLNDSRFDLDDFNPEDESTPLHGTIMKSAARTSSLKRRKYDDTPIHGPRTIILQSPSLSSAEGEEPSGNDEIPGTIDDADIVPATTNNTQTEPEEFIAVTVAAQHVDEDEPTSTMAPPLSSSMIEPSSPLSPPIGARGKEYQSIHMSTIELQSFLPRNPFRRTTRRGTKSTSKSVYDLGESATDVTSDGLDVQLSSPTPSILIDADDKSEDDQTERNQDDESFTTAPRTRARTSSRVSKPTAKSSKPTARKPLRPPKTAKSAAPSKTSHTPMQKGKRKSYRRATEADEEADKENDQGADVSYAAGEADESTTIIVEEAADKKMKKLKDKFADIDEWDLAFEIVDYGGESSPWR